VGKTTDPMGALAEAVCAVMAEVGHVQKTGKNEYGRGYTYASDADLLRALQPAMAKHGLAIMPTGTAATNDGKTVRVVMDYLLVHSGGGSVALQTACDCGNNTDKAILAASTGCYKYVLRQTFAVPTGDDPDQYDGGNHQRSQNRREEPPQATPQKDARPEQAAPPEATSGDEHHASFKSDRVGFMVRLEEVVGTSGMYAAVAGMCAKEYRWRPSGMSQANRDKLLVFLGTPEGKAKLKAYIDGGAR